MLNAPITLDPAQIREFSDNLKFIGQAFGNLPFSEKMLLSTALYNIQVISTLSILIKAETLDVTLSHYKKVTKKSFDEKPDALIDKNIRQVTGCTLVSEVISFFMVNREIMMELDERGYHQSIGYLMLLSALYGYNAAVTYDDTPKGRELKQQFIAKSMDWMTIFETVNLPELGGAFCSDLRALLCQSLVQLKVNPVKQKPHQPAYPDPYLLPHELKQLIARKNERAQQFGLPCCEMTVIHRDNSNMLFQIDLVNFVLLKNQLETIINTKITQEQHFLFYYNHDFGPVELLSARYNTITDQLELVNIGSGNQISQFYFLAALKASLEGVRYEIHACQANMLPSTNCSAFYAYLFSGILRSATVEQIKGKAFETAQPIFYDAFEQKTTAFPTLTDVHWFDVSALGEKALMLAPDHEIAKEKFLKMHPKANDAKTRFNFYMRKYNLVMGDFEGNYHHYYEYAYHRAKLHLTQLQEMPTYLEIMSRILNDDLDCEKEAQELQQLTKEIAALKLGKKAKKASKSPKEQQKKIVLKAMGPIDIKPAAIDAAKEQDGKVLRRAAAGFCKMTEFEFLLNHPVFSGLIDKLDEKKQYTPLQLSLTRQYPKRALLLLQKGAQVGVPNNKGESAQTIYEGLPDDSPIKRNEKLKTYFKS